MKEDFKFFEALQSYISPGNSWHIKDGQTLELASGNNSKDWFLPIVGIFGTMLFTGLVVAVFNNYVLGWVKRISEGHVNYNLSDHVVIIGFDAVVPSIVRKLIQDDKYKGCKILIASKKPASEIRFLVHDKVAKNKDFKRVVYMQSEHFSKEEIMLLNTPKARAIFVVGDESDDTRDANNMRLMMVLHNIHKAYNPTQENKPRIPLMMWFDNETTYAAMQLNDIKQDWSKMFIFTPYSFYRDWATRLLVTNEYTKGDDIIKYPPLDREGIGNDSDKHVHLVIVGLNRMGIAVAKEAAHLMHFPNFDEVTLKNQTLITIINDHADDEMSFFKGQHPGYFAIAPERIWNIYKESCPPFGQQTKYGNFLDVQFQFINGRIEHDKVRKWLVDEAKKEDQYLSIAICFSDVPQSMGTALYLPEELLYSGEDGSVCKNAVNIFVRQETTGAMVEMLNRAATAGQNKRYDHVYPFGMRDNSFDPHNQDRTVAQLMKYVYSYYYDNNNLLPDSLPEKGELEDCWSGKGKEESIPLQWSNIYLAHSLKFKLRSIGYDINSGQALIIDDANIDNLARVEHSRWNMEKLLMGYRAQRPEENSTWDDNKKNQAKKTHFVHKDIIPYDALDNSSKQNDINIIKILPQVVEYLKTHQLLSKSKQTTIQ